jgi:very-short-patch-repair endonuclease
VKRASTGNRYQPVVGAMCRQAGWPEPVAEQRLIPGRRFSCDLVWPDARLVVEVQGGVWLARGGHTGGKGQIDDMWKMNTLQLLGWRVLQVTPQQVTSGELQRLLADAFAVAAYEQEAAS